MAERRDVDGLNAGYAQLLLDEYLENPASVPPEWRELFERGDSPLFADHPGLARLLEAARAGNGQAAVAEPAPPAAAPAPPAAVPDDELVAAVAAAMALVKAYRTHGHLAARLDPLGSEPPGDPALDPMRYEPKLTPELQAQIPAGILRLSLEGVDVLVPMLDEAIVLAADGGAHEVALGMAHRGRLNVLAHTIGRPYESILREFEGERTIAAVSADPEGGTGDVKYHLGARGSRKTAAGEIAVTLSSNPSHLEAVDPVVEGITRAKQTDRGSAQAV